ncbi:MAG: type III toxin-antitoxin system ToxN/AbiQ family toxin [Butyrivibrio sp.]|nr:type III toxin-antitoxin system ToxN/AbiQ family toxin [Butyrivibrio sp.]
MKKMRFYYIDDNYMNFLRKYESRVPYMDKAGHRKFAIGYVLDIGGILYCAPISSNKKQHSTSLLIHQKKTGKVIASIRLGFMFPILHTVIKPVDLKKLRAKDYQYANLVGIEAKYCKTIHKKIHKLAKKLHKAKIKNLIQYCNNFSLLEKIYKEYDPAKEYLP